MPARCALQRRRPGPRRCRGGYPARGRGRDPDAQRLRRPARSGAGVRVKIGSGHCLRQTPGALSPPSRPARFTNSQFQRTAARRCAAMMACGHPSIARGNGHNCARSVRAVSGASTQRRQRRAGRKRTGFHPALAALAINCSVRLCRLSLRPA